MLHEQKYIFINENIRRKNSWEIQIKKSKKKEKNIKKKKMSKYHSQRNAHLGKLSNIKTVLISTSILVMLSWLNLVDPRFREDDITSAK